MLCRDCCSLEACNSNVEQHFCRGLHACRQNDWSSQIFWLEKEALVLGRSMEDGYSLWPCNPLRGAASAVFTPLYVMHAGEDSYMGAFCNDTIGDDYTIKQPGQS